MTYIKYPSTKHLPFSLGLQRDDSRIENLDGFAGCEIVVTEKLDGENTTMYTDHIHARSLDSLHHPSRDWAKKFWSEINYTIPTNWRICGENVYARHSIHYENLSTYFYGFSIWDENNIALSWDDTLYLFEHVFNIRPVPALYRGEFDLNMLEKLAETMNPQTQEGFVVRVANSISYEDFDLKVAKYVRKGHVQTNKHWSHQTVVPNKLMI